MSGTTQAADAHGGGEDDPDSDPAPPAGTVARGLLAEPAITRELTAEEQERLERNRIARGEDPRPTITPEHRARLEADRAAAIADHAARRH